MITDTAEIDLLKFTIGQVEAALSTAEEGAWKEEGKVLLNRLYAELRLLESGNPPLPLSTMEAVAKKAFRALKELNS